VYDAVEGWDMVSHGGFIAYYCVSTGKQAKSGLRKWAQAALYIRELVICIFPLAI
jgi:hypothetical protein